MQEQEDTVLKSMNFEGYGTENFPFWSRDGLSCKKINLNKVNFYQNFSKLFLIWIRTGHA